MKSILITGGCGFIGANFIQLALAQLGSVRLVNLDKLTYAGNLRNLERVADDPRYRFVQGDIADADLLARLFAEEAIDTVVHLAAESHVDRSIEAPEVFIQTNVVGTFTLLEAARSSWKAREGCRFLHVSTDEVFGSLGATGHFDETSAYGPRSPYSASKAGADHLVRAWFHTYGLPVVITHCTNNYGPYQFPENLIPRLLYHALHGEELPLYGDGGHVRDWIYVEDHCRALLNVLFRGGVGKTYAIGAQDERRNLTVVQALCDVLDHRLGPLAGGAARQSLIRFVKDRPGHDRRYAIDTHFIRSELDWAPVVSFAEGLERTVTWYLDHSDWFDSAMETARCVDAGRF